VIRLLKYFPTTPPIHIMALDADEGLADESYCYDLGVYFDGGKPVSFIFLLSANGLHMWPPDELLNANHDGSLITDEEVMGWLRDADQHEAPSEWIEALQFLAFDWLSRPPQELSRRAEGDAYELEPNYTILRPRLPCPFDGAMQMG